LFLLKQSQKASPPEDLSRVSRSSVEIDIEKKQRQLLQKANARFWKIKGIRTDKPFKNLKKIRKTMKKIHRIPFSLDSYIQCPVLNLLNSSCLARLTSLQSLCFTSCHFRDTGENMGHEQMLEKAQVLEESCFAI